MRDGKGMHVHLRAGHLSSARQQGQRLPDRPRGAEGRRPTAASKASRCRTPRCRRAWDRSSTARKENLVSTDNGIIMARHRLMRAAKALVDKGTRRPASIPRTTAYARPLWCCPRTRPSRMLPRKRSPRAPAWRRRRCNRSLTSQMLTLKTVARTQGNNEALKDGA